MGIDGINKATLFRDFGGLKTKDGRIVRKGLLFRSGALSLLNEDELGIVGDIGFKTVIDLRTNHEVAVNRDPEITGARYLHIAMIPEDNNGLGYGGELFGSLSSASDQEVLSLSDAVKKAYEILPFNCPAIQAAFDELQGENVPLLVHGSAGKDRTGIIAAVILLALGVSEEAVIADYLKANEDRRYVIERFFYGVREFAHGDEEIMKKMIWVPGTDAINIEAMLKEIKRRHGDSETYLKEEYHQSPAKLDRLRDLYLA